MLVASSRAYSNFCFSMSKIPIFPVTQPPHFTDYGFEPQIDYYQALEEARKQKRESTSSRSRDLLLHFKLQKPISKDDSSKKIKKTKKRWWRNPLLFFKFPRWAPPDAADPGCRRHRHRVPGPAAYITESRSGSSTPYRTASRPAGSGEVEIPYISLRELNMDQSHRIYATSPTPIYLVT